MKSSRVDGSRFGSMEKDWDDVEVDQGRFVPLRNRSGSIGKRFGSIWPKVDQRRLKLIINDFNRF